ncbi:ectoine/hydroxyectoine ABC transporter substrate-binding protein EhuB [Bradyrhizobium sp. DASA03007]|uniref:ectoine/hydroxyectoine ABC transporter substrate-binding protein EhuB n=1 Tax=unclassified Bradyrhizobium TaxID=2631580 RepID=UPI003F717302
MGGTPKLSFLVLLLTLAGQFFPTLTRADDPLASIRKAGKVTVALASAPPYMIVAPSGEVTGSFVDLQNMVLKRLGLPALTPVLADWAAMIPGLQVKRFDFIGAGFNITELYCKGAIFSTPVYAAHAALFVRAGNPKHLTSAGDIARQLDLKLAVIGKGSPYEQYALKQGVKPEQIIYVPDIQAGVATVSGGRADAYTASQFAITDPEKQRLEIVVPKDAPVVASGWAFRKEDVAFRDAFNKELNLLLKDGTAQQLFAKYEVPHADIMLQLISKFTKASDVDPSCE